MSSLFERAGRRLAYRFVHRMRRRAIYPYLYRSTWRSILGRKTRAGDAPNNYLTANPHPGAGIGHQMANTIAGYWYAGLFGCRYAHTPFPDPKWEALLGFGQGEASARELRASGYRMVRLPLFDEDNEREVARIRHIVSAHAHRKVLFLLERDQFLRALHLPQDALRAKFLASEARRKSPLFYDPDEFNIAVHVRRGDVSLAAAARSENIGLRWQEVDYFERVLDQVVALLETDRRVRIYLFSQGAKEDFASFSHHPNLQLCLETDAYSSFLHLAAADVLIASKSGFSYGAALLGEGVKLMPSPFWHGYPDDPDWIETAGDGTFDTTRLKAASARR